jgi:nanoRNase/pAp phosphatase (c-di-AMP/oligoRNAs hydrolase)
MLSNEDQIFKLIKKSNNILITFPVDWNGDSISSALALFLFLKEKKKKVDIIADKTLSYKSEELSSAKTFSFLPSFAEIKNNVNNVRKFIVSLDITNAKVDKIKYTLEKNKLNFIISPKEGFFSAADISSSANGFKYDLIITINTLDLESLGKTYDNNIEFFYKTPIINIDNHPSNEEFGQINFIDLNAISNSEIIFSLIKKDYLNIINENIATCLLSGIIYSSKSFKTPNLTPKTLLITSQLITLGAKREKIINNLYRSRSLESLKLWGKILSNLSSDKNNSVIYSSLKKEDFIKTNLNSKHLLSVIDELIANIPNAKIIIIFYPHQKDLNQTNFILYSVKNINSLEIAKEYEPKGTQKIIQAKIAKPLNEAKKEVIEIIKNKLAQTII